MHHHQQQRAAPADRRQAGQTAVPAANLSTLHQLASQTDRSCVSRCTSRLHLGLLPSCLGGRLRAAVHRAIAAKLCKYDQQMDGILLGFENAALCSSTGISVSNSARIHIDVQAELFVFRPTIGALLSGAVVKKHGARATCLVHEVFTVFVTVAASVRSRVRLQQPLVFRVDHVDLCSRIPLVTGHTDNECWPSDDLHVTGSTSGSHVDCDSGISCTEDNAHSAGGVASGCFTALADDVTQMDSGGVKHRRWRTPSLPLPPVTTREPPQGDDSPAHGIVVGARRPRMRRRIDTVSAVATDDVSDVGATSSGRPRKRGFTELSQDSSSVESNKKRSRCDVSPEADAMREYAQADVEFYDSPKKQHKKKKKKKHDL